MVYNGYMSANPPVPANAADDGPSYPLRGTRAGVPSVGVEKVRYSHDAMVDLLVANPWITQNEIAATFGYSPGWVSTVMSCDAFQVRLAARREELIDPTIRATLEERFRAVVTRSLEVLQTKLSAPAAAVPDNLALRAMELGAKALGIGGNAPPKVQITPTDHLEQLAQNLIRLQSNIRQGAAREQVIEVEARETPGPAEWGGQDSVRPDASSSGPSTLQDGGGNE